MGELKLCHGAVKCFYPSKGYGFIRCADMEEDVFVSRDEILQEDMKLVDGACVEFELARDEQGRPQARSVLPVQRPASVEGRYVGVSRAWARVMGSWIARRPPNASAKTSISIAISFRGSRTGKHASKFPLAQRGSRRQAK